MRSWLVALLFFLSSVPAIAQREPDRIYMKNIRTVKFNQFGDPVSYPIVSMNGNNLLELHFDDM
ncbi:MAG TPA: DUF5103 domain-containing protein, partial [Chitinophagaceae bacterium]|nr:DUF5103 domain-containing protein [Chitinophagaceae bacterium]